jgi:hypothetical protein
MDIQETALPGVGLGHEFTACAGRHLGVVSYRTGRRDLLLYDPDDPDTCHEVIRFTHEEADALADLLGAARLTGHLAELQQQIVRAGDLLADQRGAFAVCRRHDRRHPGSQPHRGLHRGRAAGPDDLPRAHPASSYRPVTPPWWSAPRPASGPWPDSWTADRHGHGSAPSRRWHW